MTAWGRAKNTPCLRMSQESAGDLRNVRSPPCIWMGVDRLWSGCLAMTRERFLSVVCEITLAAHRRPRRSIGEARVEGIEVREGAEEVLRRSCGGGSGGLREAGCKHP